MGRPRKVIVDGIETEQAEPEPVTGRVAFIKNGVTILRDVSEERKLADDGWKRK